MPVDTEPDLARFRWGLSTEIGAEAASQGPSGRAGFIGRERHRVKVGLAVTPLGSVGSAPGGLLRGGFKAGTGRESATSTSAPARSPPTS
jgi:hypothetical protein